MNRFNWRPWETAPRDNTPVVCLRVIRHVGGWSRPIDLVPELCVLSHNGYWRNERHSVGDPDLKHCHWTTPEEYAAAIPAEDWRKAPKDYFGVGPVAFVRPIEPRHPEWIDRVVYSAIIAWTNGAPMPSPDPWYCESATLKPIADGFLDGENTSELPFRWCTLGSFFPQAVFDAENVSIDNVAAWQKSRVQRWRNT